MVFMKLKDDRSEKVQYDFPDYPIYIRRGKLSAYPDYAAPSHWHDAVELIAVLSGEMQYNVNGERIILRENEGVFVNARQLHFGFSPERRECDFLCVLLHPGLLCSTAAYERDFILPVVSSQSAAFIKLCADVPWQRGIYEDIRAICAVRNETAAPLKVQRLFANIWTALYENLAPEQQPGAQSADLPVLKNMVGFIQQNYASKISLADIAASGAVGQSKCCKLFEKYTGQSPNVYLTRYRLDKSMALLKNTELSVTEIAGAVGFGGGSYYAEVFRKWNGKSPTTYRKSG